MGADDNNVNHPHQHHATSTSATAAAVDVSEESDDGDGNGARCGRWSLCHSADPGTQPQGVSLAFGVLLLSSGLFEYNKARLIW